MPVTRESAHQLSLSHLCWILKCSSHWQLLYWLLIFVFWVLFVCVRQSHHDPGSPQTLSAEVTDKTTLATFVSLKCLTFPFSVMFLERVGIMGFFADIPIVLFFIVP